MVFPYTQKDAIMQQFVEMIDGNTNGNPEDTGFAAASWSPGRGQTVSFVVANIEGHSNTTAFARVGDLSPLIDMRVNQPITSIAAQIASTTGKYQIWNTLTYHNTLDMGHKIFSSFEAVIKDIEGHVDVDEDLTIVYLMTPFPTLFSSYGDNVLGLDMTHTRNSVVFSLQAMLPTTKYREILKQRLGEAVADIEAYAKDTGQHVPYLYLNYAGPEQNPLSGYGEENIRFMKEVAKIYDPTAFFQYRVSGGFKLKDL